MRPWGLLLCVACAHDSRPAPFLSELAAAGRWEDVYCYAEDPHDLGMALRYMGNLDAALACLSEGEPSEDLGFVLKLLGRHDEAAGVFGQLLSDDPLTLYNLAGALHDAGHDEEPLLLEVLTRTTPDDEVYLNALEDLADDLSESGDWEHAERLRAEVEYLEPGRE